MGPSLFNEVEPVAMWVEIGEQPMGPHDDTRPLRVRVKPSGRRSLHAVFEVSRYAPEWTIFAALTHFFRDLDDLQAVPTEHVFRQLFTSNCSRFIEPF